MLDDIVRLSKSTPTSLAADSIREHCDGILDPADVYEFIHAYISAGGVLEPLYLAVSEETVKRAKMHIISKLLKM